MTTGDRVQLREPTRGDSGYEYPVGWRGMVTGFEGQQVVVSLDDAEGDVAVVAARTLEVVNRRALS